MRSLTYALIAGVAFWCGMVVAVANRPTPPLVRVVHAQPAKYVPPNCVELFRVCQQQKRSARTRGDK